MIPRHSRGRAVATSRSWGDSVLVSALGGPRRCSTNGKVGSRQSRSWWQWLRLAAGCSSSSKSGNAPMATVPPVGDSPDATLPPNVARPQLPLEFRQVKAIIPATKPIQAVGGSGSGLGVQTVLHARDSSGPPALHQRVRAALRSSPRVLLPPRAVAGSGRQRRFGRGQVRPDRVAVGRQRSLQERRISREGRAPAREQADRDRARRIRAVDTDGEGGDRRARYARSSAGSRKTVRSRSPR